MTPYDQILKHAVAQKMSLSEVAEANDLSVVQVRAACYRRGIKLPCNSHGSVIEAVQDMKPREAIDYLLDVVQQYEDFIFNESNLPVANLTPTEARVLSALISKAPRIVSTDRLYTAVYAHLSAADDIPAPKAITVVICKLRKKLNDAGRVVTVGHSGYQWIERKNNAL